MRPILSVSRVNIVDRIVQGAKAAKAAKDAKVLTAESVDNEDSKVADAKETRPRATSAAKGSKDVWSKESDYY